jgi:hypothetical protein
MRIIELVLAQIDLSELNQLLLQLRALDQALDMKMDEVRVAQQNVGVWDRLNVFTHSDAELALKAESKEYQRIRGEHSNAVNAIKTLIREAIYRDFAVALKVQTTEIMQTVSALRVQHKYGIGKAHEYRIEGLAPLTNRIAYLDSMISEQCGFPVQPLSGEDVLELVYEDVLRKGGFII